MLQQYPLNHPPNRFDQNSRWFDQSSRQAPMPTLPHQRSKPPAPSLRQASPPARLLTLLMVVACATAVSDAKVVHVEEGHRSSMLANGLGSTPPMG
jgi:hypothetical protein